MFLNPWMAFGAALALVPVVIHLLARRRYRVIPWAAMHLLLDALRKNRQRMQLHDRILMLLRALAVVCLAITLARPTLTGRAAGWAGASSNALVILMDVSGSMGCHDGRETRLEAARRVVKSLLAQADPNTTVAVLAFSHDVRMPLGEPTRNLAFLDQELDGAILQTDAATNLERAVEKAMELLRSRSDLEAVQREVYVLTDLQSYPWGEQQVTSRFSKTLAELNREAGVVLVDVGDVGTANLAVKSLSLSDPLARVGVLVQVSVIVQNFGRVPAVNVPVDFYVDPEPGGAPANRITIDVAPGGQAVGAFETLFSKGGEHRLEVRIGPDRMAGDNRCFAVVDVQSGTDVLLVDGGDPGSEDLQTRESAYLQMALSAADASNRREARVADVLPAYQLDERDFGDYQAVVLCDVPWVDSAVAQALLRQVRAGMGLLIFLGERSDPDGLNWTLGPEGVDLLPAEVGVPWGEAPVAGAGEPPAFRPFARDADSLAHPVMAEFRSAEMNALLAPVRVYRGWSLRPLEEESNLQVILTYEDREPAILERRIGAGVVILVGFPATTAWSNLATQYFFPVLVPRLMTRLTVGQRSSWNLTVGEALRGSLGTEEQQYAVAVHPPPPEGRRQATVEMATAHMGGRLPYHYDETDRAGFYEVTVDRPGGTPRIFAVNPSVAREADLTRIDADEIRRRYPGFEFTYIRKDENLVSRLAAERRGVEVWPWFLGLVFLLLGCESYLALRWAPRE